MTRVEEIEYSQFRNWFLNQDWKNWDKKIEEDSMSGNLNFLFAEAAEAKKKTKLRSL